MGLDMYLYKKSYVKNWSHQDKKLEHEISVKMGGETRKDIKPERVSYITEEVAYWRKFNALHGWFVNECADGTDECQEIYVSGEKMNKLLETLKRVKELISNSKLVSKVSEDFGGKEYEHQVYECGDEVMDLLPPTEGFFFGSEEVDDYYKECVEDTITTIEGLLKEDEESSKYGLYGGEYYYRASW